MKMKDLKRWLLGNEAFNLRIVISTLIIVIMVILTMVRLYTTVSAATPTDKITFRTNEAQYHILGPVEKPEILLGDVDSDGYVTMADVICLRQYLAQMRGLSKEALIAADVNKDGRISIIDAVMIQQYCLFIYFTTI